MRKLFNKMNVFRVGKMINMRNYLYAKKLKSKN
jgi:hypothetical protein